MLHYCTETEGCTQYCVALMENTVDGFVCPLLQPLKWLYVEGTQLTLTDSVLCCSLRK
jgi:hypothetical protein